MFIYDKYDSESCFYFGLSEKEKYQILYEDYLEEQEKIKNEIIRSDGYENYEHYYKNIA
jgi:uncharacterized protein YtpQ (UPF0354 family)